MYNVIDNERKIDADTLKKDRNFVVFSSLKDFFCPVWSKNFSIKYVQTGSERYHLNGNFYEIKAGEYLLTNGESEGTVEIDNKELVNGICINIIPGVLSEVVASFKQPGTAFSDLSLDNFFTTGDFLESQYKSRDTSLGKFLSGLGSLSDIENGNNPSFNAEFYYTLSEKIVTDNIPVYKQLQAIRTVKQSTKKDLLKRVYRGRDYIDFNFRKSISIENIAREAMVSEYHFFRLFKAVFGISPHQYIISKRLTFANEMLKKKGFRVSDAAIESGFSDIYSFSKAFKKYYCISPSELQVR